MANYPTAGTRVWVVRPETKAVEDYVPGQPVNVVGDDGSPDGGDVLPGFSLDVSKIFPD